MWINEITGRKSHTSRRRLNGKVHLRSLFTSHPFPCPYSQSAVCRLNLLYQIASVSIENTIGIRSPKSLYEEVDPKHGYPVCPLHERFVTVCSRTLSPFCYRVKQGHVCKNMGCAFIVKMHISIYFVKIIFQSVQTETNFPASGMTMNNNKFNLKSLGGSMQNLTYSYVK
jgi:hypothetical protein